MSEILTLKKQLEERRKQQIEEILEVEKESLKAYVRELKKILESELNTIESDIKSARKSLKIASWKMLLMSYVLGAMSVLVLIVILFEIVIEQGQILLLWRW